MRDEVFSNTQENEPLETLSGYVHSVIFENETNGYKVLSVGSDNGLELDTVCGVMPDVEIGEHLEAKGHYTLHATYGEQFSVKEYSRSVPDTTDGVEHYLGSGVIKGVGESLAKRIVEEFGEETFRVLENEPERLEKIKGISLKKACEIGEQFAEKKSSREAMIYLGSLGLTVTMAMRIYQTLGENTVSLVKKNPYLLAERVTGIGFARADEIAERTGIAKDSPERIKAGIRFVLQQALSEGHTFLPRGILREQVAMTLRIGENEAENAIASGLMTGDLIERRKNIYLRPFFAAERGTAGKLSQLCRLGKEMRPNGLWARLRAIEEKDHIELSDEQREAIVSAIEEGVLIITGGPGTGKTTIINVLLELLDEHGKKYLLAAPTGKAAKRMEEATGREAKTIHRLLEVQSMEGTGGSAFQRNEDHPLETDYVIIDEVSMVDIALMYNLLKAIPAGTHLVLLGDRDQLPSVGPGNVLHDMIESGPIPVKKLTHIYRQSSESMIVFNAHRINVGQYPLTSNAPTSDFFLGTARTLEEAEQTLIQIATDRFPRYAHLDPVQDIQVLCPSKKGPLGVVNLNKKLQQALNPARKKKGELQQGERIFREGDKVMQMRNNYEMEWNVYNRYDVAIDTGKGVFNGDTGRIETIDRTGVTVVFDGRRKVLYDFMSLSQIELAYAITIHKSQGTESPAVVLPIMNGPVVLMTRNLLYTAITRAKRFVVIIGQQEALNRMVDNDRQTERYSDLALQIRESFGLFDEAVFDDGIERIAVPESMPFEPGGVIDIDDIAALMENEGI